MSRLASWRVSNAQVSTATFSPDGEFIATSDVNGDVRLWQTDTGREVRRYPASGEKLQCVIFSPDGRLLAGSAAGSPRVYVWDVDNTQRILDLKVEESNNNIWSIAFSADSKMLATPHLDNTVKLWELPSGIRRGTLRGHIQAVYGVAFSPDGKTLATGSDDRKVKLWNLATLQEMATLGPLTGGCRSLRFSPDGSILAVGHYVTPHPYTWLWEAPSFDEIAAAEATQKTGTRQP
jgi:WD40 repeat protein